MRLITVLVLAGLILGLFIALRAKAPAGDRSWLPMLIVVTLALGLASCAILQKVSGQNYGVDVGDPGRP